jgi:hypothetical protein
MIRLVPVLVSAMTLAAALTSFASATTTRTTAVIYGYDRATTNAQVAPASAPPAPVSAGARAPSTARRSVTARSTGFLAAESAAWTLTKAGGAYTGARSGLLHGREDATQPASSS